MSATDPDEAPAFLSQTERPRVILFLCSEWTQEPLLGAKDGGGGGTARAEPGTGRAPGSRRTQPPALQPSSPTGSQCLGTQPRSLESEREIPLGGVKPAPRHPRVN